MALALSDASLSEDTDSVIVLEYTDADLDKATSCELSNLSNISVVSDDGCECLDGVCTVGVRGTLNYNGSASFDYTVTAKDAVSNTATATLTIAAVNDSPTVVIDESTHSTDEDTDASALDIEIGDLETDVDSLTLSGSSSNTLLVPNGRIDFAGTGANRTVTVRPAPNQYGTATITVTVTDGGSATATDSFTLTVVSVPEWTLTTAGNHWWGDGSTGAINMALSISGDGQKMVAIQGDGDANKSAYVSVDGGDTWNQAADPGVPGQRLQLAGYSQNGNKLVQVFLDKVVVSADDGATWSTPASLARIYGAGSYNSLSMNADGSVIVITDTYYWDPEILSTLYVSNDGGATFAESAAYNAIQQYGNAPVAVVSRDGTNKLFLADDDGNAALYSTNLGASFTQMTTVSPWGAYGGPGGISISATDDLSSIFVGYGGFGGPTRHIRKLSNITGSWEEIATPGSSYFSVVAVSADGSHLAIAAGANSMSPGNYIYISTDGGATWTEQTALGVGLWNSLAFSSDGSVLIATTYNKGVWILK